jgi:hypothetical protein
MLKKILSSVLFLAIAGTGAIFAQSRVALHSARQVTIFGGASPFADACNAAVSGDTVYLSGGAFVAPAEINKGIAVFGAGHYPDSTAVTGQTSVGGNITVKSGADNLHLEGIFFTGNITFNTDEKVDNVIIALCRINGTLTYSSSTIIPTTPCENHQIIQSVLVGDLNLNNLTGSMITNCIIQNRIVYGSNLSILNNVFLSNSGSGYYANTMILNSIKGVTVSNNIFLARGGYSGNIQGGCVGQFSYNLFTATLNFDANVISTGNYLNVAADDIFVSAADNVFDYTDDYHLQDPETYVGMDGTQVGIYGGALGYKPGAVPSNPHFSSATIAPTTDGEGKLNVNIKVIAQ